MSHIEVLPLLAGLLFVSFGIGRAMGWRLNTLPDWLIPAILSVGFLLYSAATIRSEGPLGFWVEHTRNMWGNQIWFDLLLAAGAAWFLIVPRARTVGIAPLPWFFAIAATGSIGIMALLAILLFKESHQSKH